MYYRNNGVLQRDDCEILWGNGMSQIQQPDSSTARAWTGLLKNAMIIPTGTLLPEQAVDVE
jgi:hypothetical protein